MESFIWNHVCLRNVNIDQERNRCQYIIIAKSVNKLLACRLNTLDAFRVCIRVDSAMVSFGNLHSRLVYGGAFEASCFWDSKWKQHKAPLKWPSVSANESCPVNCKWLSLMEAAILDEPFQPIRVLLIANSCLLWRTPFSRQPICKTLFSIAQQIEFLLDAYRGTSMNIDSTAAE